MVIHNEQFQRQSLIRGKKYHPPNMEEEYTKEKMVNSSSKLVII